MFEHYSVADLFANLYKKRKVNLLALLALFALIAVPFTLKAVKNKNTVKDSTSYSTYITYKITAPETSSKTILNHQVGGYSDFYAKLIDGNLNGAFLFNDVDSDKMKEIAKDLDTTETALKNSASDYWTKKLTINPLIDDAGVTVKILTPSKEVNDFLESKFEPCLFDDGSSFLESHPPYFTDDIWRSSSIIIKASNFVYNSKLETNISPFFTKVVLNFFEFFSDFRSIIWDF